MNATLPDRAGAAGLRLLARAAATAPRVTERAVVALCDSVRILRPAAYRTVVENLLPFTDFDHEAAHRAARQVFRNVGRYYVDLARLPALDLQQFTDEQVAIVPWENIPAVTDPGPVIIVSAHFGTPEISLQACLAHGRPFLAVVERLQTDHIREQLRAFRQSQGGVFVDADYQGLKEAMSWLRRGDVVGFVADRDIVGNGICVQFGGRDVRIARGPWQLAQRTGARIVPVFTPRRGPFQYTAELGEPIRIARNSGEAGMQAAAQTFATMAEERIRRAPGQWTVLEPFWERHACGQG